MLLFINYNFSQFSRLFCLLHIHCNIFDIGFNSTWIQFFTIYSCFFAEKNGSHGSSVDLLVLPGYVLGEYAEASEREILRTVCSYRMERRHACSCAYNCGAASGVRKTNGHRSRRHPKKVGSSESMNGVKMLLANLDK